jgi:hypothetical protein
VGAAREQLRIALLVAAEHEPRAVLDREEFHAGAPFESMRRSCTASGLIEPSGIFTVGSAVGA